MLTVKAHINHPVRHESTFKHSESYNQGLHGGAEHGNSMESARQNTAVNSDSGCCRKHYLTSKISDKFYSWLHEITVEFYVAWYIQRRI